MNLKLLAIFSFLSISYTTLAQRFTEYSAECAYDLPTDSILQLQPWYGNNDFLVERKLQKMEARTKDVLPHTQSIYSVTNSNCSPEFDYLIPIHFIIWRGAELNLDENTATVNTYLQEANLRFQESGSRIQFYLQSTPQILINEQFANSPNPTVLNQVYQTYFNHSRVTIHLVTGLLGYPAGQGRMPFNAINRSGFIRTNLYDQNDRIQMIGGVLAHELGHILGLYHTHANRRGDADDNGSEERKCFQESVSRIKQNYWYQGCSLETNNDLKCAINGDQLCDTEADPNMSRMFVSLPTDINPCQASANFDWPIQYRQDLWEVEWQPNARNIMGYNNLLCRNVFSQGQIGVMEYYLDGQFSNLPTKTVTGPYSIPCNTQVTYSIPSVNGATYHWTANAGTSIVAGQGTNQVVVSGHNGPTSYGEVSVEVSSPHVNFCLSRNITSGYGNVGATLSGPTTMQVGSAANFSVTGATGVYNYEWILPGGYLCLNCWEIIYGGNGTTTAYIRAGEQSGWLSVKLYTSCGFTSVSTYVTVTTGGGGGPLPAFHSMSPNPANNYVELDFGDEEIVYSSNQEVYSEPVKSAISNYRQEYEVSIFDGNQSKVLSIKSSQRKLRLDVSELKEGIYFVHIVTAEKAIQRKLIIQRGR